MKLYWRRVILYVTAMGMESCWLYALMALLNEKVADGRLSIFGLLLLYPLAFGFNRLLWQLRWRKAYVRGITWLARMRWNAATNIIAALKHHATAADSLVRAVSRRAPKTTAAMMNAQNNGMHMNPSIPFDMK